MTTFQITLIVINQLFVNFLYKFLMNLQLTYVFLLMIWQKCRMCYLTCHTSTTVIHSSAFAFYSLSIHGQEINPMPITFLSKPLLPKPAITILTSITKNLPSFCSINRVLSLSLVSCYLHRIEL